MNSKGAARLIGLLSAGALCLAGVAQAVPERSWGSSYVGTDGLPVDAPPIPVRMATPDYPREALRKALGGRAVACFTVSSSGRIRDAVVVESSHELFRRPTLKAVQKSTFKPARRGREQVAGHLCRTYRYSLEERGWGY